MVPVVVLVVAADVVVGVIDRVSLVLEVVVVFGSEVVGDHVTVVVEVAVVVGTGVVNIAEVEGIADHVLLVDEVSREVAVGVDHVSGVVETVVVVITGVVVESRVVSLVVEAVVLRDVISVVVVVGGSAVEVKLIISAIIKRRIHKSTYYLKIIINFNNISLYSLSLHYIYLPSLTFLTHYHSQLLTCRHN